MRAGIPPDGSRDTWLWKRSSGNWALETGLTRKRNFSRATEVLARRGWFWSARVAVSQFGSYKFADDGKFFSGVLGDIVNTAMSRAGNCGPQATLISTLLPYGVAKQNCVWSVMVIGSPRVTVGIHLWIDLAGSVL